MMDNHELSHYMDASVLCWLATVSADGQPNVAPKEVFCLYEDDLLIANIASPKSVRNIGDNVKVCVSLIDVFEEKGCKVYGTAMLVTKDDSRFLYVEKPLAKITQGHYEIKSIILINVDKVMPIIAPSYIKYPEQNMDAKRLNTMKNYGVKPINDE